MSRKLIVTVLMLAFAVAAIGAGTWAYFSDTETTTANKLTAGTLDLKISNSVDSHYQPVWQDDPIAKCITVENVKPGDAWVQVVSPSSQVTLKNAGTVPGRVWYEIVNLHNNENGLTDPEIKAGDLTGGGDAIGLDQGELQAEFQMSTTENRAPWNGWQSMSKLVNNQIGQGAVLQPGETVPLVFRYRWDPSNTQNDNLAQTDQITFDVVFHMDQAH
jgi:spore coat-associated protein N